MNGCDSDVDVVHSEVASLHTNEDRQSSVINDCAVSSEVRQAVDNSNSFIHSFKNLLGAPSRNLLRGAPSPATAIQISLKQPAKRTFIIFRQDTNFQRESIPGGGANNGECATLPSCSFSTRHQ